MKKKAQSVQRTRKPAPDAKAKVGEAQSPPERTPSVPASTAPSSAWLEMVSQIDEPIRRREAGPGMDLLHPGDALPAEPEPGRGRSGRYPVSPLFGVQQVVPIVDGVCDGCLEKITTPKDHEWWCPWWDTPEGKRAVPF